MILLSDEEITLALSNQGYTDEVHAELQVMAKAQLKKVVEHLEAIGMGRACLHQLEGNHIFFTITAEEWQSLKEEAGL